MIALNILFVICFIGIGKLISYTGNNPALNMYSIYTAPIFNNVVDYFICLIFVKIERLYFYKNKKDKISS